MPRMLFPRLLLLLSLASTVYAAEVREFGAKGDGQADDTAAVQRAVDAGGEVFFKRGTYKITKPVVVTLDQTGFVAIRGDGTARLVMAGAGPAIRFVGTHGGTAAPESVKPEVWERQRQPIVDGLEIVGSHAEADGVQATGTMAITLTKLNLRGLRHGIHLIERNRNVLISDCHIYQNRGIGIFLDAVNLHQTNIIGSHISYNGGGGVVSRGGDVRNVHIGTCDIEANMAPDMPPTANVLLDCTGGSIAEVSITGCTIQHTCKVPGSANIRILGEGDGGEKLGKTRDGHVTIASNVFSDVDVNIHVVKTRGVVITGNTFWEGFEHDLLVEDSSHVVLGANNFDRNPRYIWGKAADFRGGLTFKNSRDCTINGVSVSGARRQPAAIVLEKCSRFHVTNCTLLDNDGAGILLKDVENSRISGNFIRDDRADAAKREFIQVEGGKGLILDAPVK